MGREDPSASVNPHPIRSALLLRPAWRRIVRHHPYFASKSANYTKAALADPV